MRKRYNSPKRSSSYLRNKWRRRAWARRRKRSFADLLGRLGIANLSRFALGVGIVAILILSFMSAVFSIGLPNPSNLTVQRATESTKVLDRSGVVLYDIYNEHRRTLINFESIPDYVKQATLSAEDKDFYLHSGFDMKGLIRGVILKPLSGQRAQGGSTITQQYAKNVFLTASRSVVRKIKEFILAVELEQLYTKDKIFELYLNGIPYGGSYYGIEVAAQGYFGKSANDLSLAEAATLAAMPQAPSYYSPYGSDYENRLLPRKDWVLKRMFEEGYINEDEMEEAKIQELKFLPRKDSIRAPHFVNYVKELLADKYGEKALEEGGLTIITTLDWKKQEMAEQAIANRIEINRETYNAGNAALVSMNPNTGEILAMVGSAGYFDTDIDGYVNVAVRERQPGSAFKPIVYTAAFDKGYSPATMLMDVRTNFGQGYTPGNYDGEFRGPVSIRTALQESLNVPAVKTLAYVGVYEAISLAHDLGITTLTEPEKYGLSLVLGGAEIKLTELTAAYGVLAAGGKRSSTMAVLKVVDRKGKVLEENKPQKLRRVLNEEAAYLTNNILSDDAARAPAFGAGGYLALPGRPVAAKTGTTQEYRDGWTIGYTPDLVTGVWVGNNDNTSMQNGAGYSVASPIWNAYMRKATASMPVRSFNVPDGIQSVVVDAVSGKLPTDFSLGTKTEVFKNGSAPREIDDVHKKIRVAKADPNFLAPAHWPEDQVIYKIFSEFHSERPNNSAWEQPVLDWAEENEHNKIPNRYYDGTVQSSGEINIISPQSGQKLTGESFVIITTVKNPSSVQEVGFYYDGALIYKTSSAPWTAEVTNVVLDGKSHLVAARLFKKDGANVETTLNVLAGEGQSNLISMQNVPDNFFPLDLIAKLTDKGKQLNLEKIDMYLDGKAIQSFLPNTSGLYVARVNEGFKGQHITFAKIYLKNGTSYNSNTINFETR